MQYGYCVALRNTKHAVLCTNLRAARLQAQNKKAYYAGCAKVYTICRANAAAPWQQCNPFTGVAL